MLTDYWAHYFYDNPKAEQDTVEDTDFDLQAELSRLEENPDDWEPM